MSREFDVIVYGATGFTGRLVAEYLQEQYGSDVSWAMAGRSQEKLEAVRDEMGVSKDVALIVANSDKPETLTDMAARTKSVCTTVGPYQLYGDPLVEACVTAGTDYVDLSGEPPWMVDTIAKYSEAAKASGARIVHSCGFDSIPFDLGVYFLQQHAIAHHGGACAKVRGRVRKMKGTFSGGTAASFGETAPFIMASINTKNIHRSNALLGHLYGEDFVYDEMVLTGPGEKGKAAAEYVAKDDSMAKNPPKQGEGPKARRRAKQGRARKRLLRRHVCGRRARRNAHHRGRDG